MDVVLDANTYLADPRMGGVGFQSLLDYLRKTQSRLIVPKVIMDEVVARYPERLHPNIKRATSEISSLRRLVFNARVMKVPEIDIAQETRALKSKLNKPSKHVKSVLLKNFRDISLEEVARRGIERMPPASAAGEELRDVITWLMILEYAKKSGKEIAFITADKHFRQETVLHPQLAKEVHESKVTLHFYTSIDEFIKAHAPAPHELDAAQAFDLLGKSHVLDRFEIEARSFFPSYWRTALATEVIARDVEFSHGALYDVGQGSEYGEMEFSGQLNVRVTTPSAIFITNTTLPTSPLVNFHWVESGSIKTPQPGKLVPMSTLAGPITIADFKTTASTFAPDPMGGNITDYRVSGTLVISMRLRSGKVTRVETERFDLGQIAALSKSEKN